MKIRQATLFLLSLLGSTLAFAQSTPLFKADLSNSIAAPGVWSVADGVITATKDETLWSKKEYLDFVLDLDFKNADSTNSGVFVHGSNTKDFVSHSVEIQIADDYSHEWSSAPRTWQCGAIFGHQATNKEHVVKKPGEWNHYRITCKGSIIKVELNGELVNVCDLRKYTSAKVNPDGSTIPSWLSNPLASLPLKGHIGFQGKHAGSPIYFKNIMIRET